MRVLRFENEAEDLLHYLKESGLHPGLEGTLANAGSDEIQLDASGLRAVLPAAWPKRCRWWPTRRRPHAWRSRPARAGQRALRTLSSAVKSAAGDRSIKTSSDRLVGAQGVYW